MEKQIVTIDPKQFGLEESKAADIAAQFKPMLDKMVELEAEYNKVIALPIESAAKQAKELRLKYVKVRTGTAAIHKAQKDFYLAGGRYVDGWKNAQLFASQGIEEKLEAIEKHAENLERERIAKLQEERQAQLDVYEMYNVPNLGSMELAVWESFLLGTKTSFEQRKEAERIAEEQRLAAIETKRIEDERIRKENEALRAEQARIEAARLAEQKEAQRILDEQRKLQEAELAAHRELARKSQAEQEAKLIAEQKERNRIAAELQAEKDRQASEEAAKLAAQEAELSKGDKEKFFDLINDLDAIKAKYQFKSKKYKDMHASVGELINKTIAFAQSKTI